MKIIWLLTLILGTSFRILAQTCDTTAIQLPWMEDFESWTAFPCNWHTLDMDGDSETWVVFEGNSGTYLASEAYNSVDVDDWAFMPPVQLNSGTLYNLSFQYAIGNYSTDESFEVWLCRSASPDSTVFQLAVFDELSYETVPFSDLPFQHAFDVSENGNYFIAFRRTSSIYQHRVTIDNISLEEITGCPPVNNLVSLPQNPYVTKISWSDTTSSSWIVEYGNYNFTPGTGTAAIVSDTTFLIERNYSDYYFISTCYVYPNCPSGLDHVNTVNLSFGCLVDFGYSFPYDDDFNYSTDGYLPCGWLKERQDSLVSTWNLLELDSVNRALQCSANLIDDRDWLISPKFTLDSSIIYSIELDVASPQNSPIEIRIFNGDQHSSSQMTNLLGVISADTSVFSHKTLLFNNLLAGAAYFGISVISDIDAASGIIDNFRIQKMCVDQALYRWDDSLYCRDEGLSLLPVIGMCGYYCFGDSLLGLENCYFQPGELPNGVYEAFVVSDTTLCADTVRCIIYIEDCMLGMDQLTIEKPFVYPNPTSARIDLSIPSEIEIQDLSVYDAEGRQQSVLISIEKKYIDLSTLANGTYILQIWSNYGIDEIRVVLNH